MLSNAYFLAKFRFDTAENEPAKNLQNFANFPNLASAGLVEVAVLGAVEERGGGRRAAAEGQQVEAVPLRRAGAGARRRPLLRRHRPRRAAEQD